MTTDEAFRQIIQGRAEPVLPDAEQQLRAIIKAYLMTKDDPNARIPTLLMALIESARAR